MGPAVNFDRLWHHLGVLFDQYAVAVVVVAALLMGAGYCFCRWRQRIKMVRDVEKYAKKAAERRQKK